MQARSFTELKVLNREVRAVLHSADQGSRVYGELVFPEDGKPVSLAASLLGAGFARYVDWSARLLPLKPPAALASAAALKKAETTAQVRCHCSQRTFVLRLAAMGFSQEQLFVSCVGSGSGGAFSMCFVQLFALLMPVMFPGPLLCCAFSAVAKPGSGHLWWA